MSKWDYLFAGFVAALALLAVLFTFLPRTYWKKKRGRSLVGAGLAVFILVGLPLQYLASAQRYEQEIAELRAQHQQALGQMVQRSERLSEIRQRQIERIRLAIAGGELFNATLLWLNVAETVVADELEDPRTIELVAEMAREMIDKASSKQVPGP